MENQRDRLQLSLTKRKKRKIKELTIKTIQVFAMNVYMYTSDLRRDQLQHHALTDPPQTRHE